jgi:hypothetical protein
MQSSASTKIVILAFCLFAGGCDSFLYFYGPRGREIVTITREETDVTAFEYRLAKLGAGFSSGERSNEKKTTITLDAPDPGINLLVIIYRVGIGGRVEHIRFEEHTVGLIAHSEAREPNHFPELAPSAVH